jgi:superfamily I DNA and/or RNA helicase/very-short-patch-repair endonuclease
MADFNNKLEQVRKRLLDLTKRNKLISYKRPPASKNLKIIDESAEFIYKHLVLDEKQFIFKFIPQTNTKANENKPLNKDNYIKEQAKDLNFDISLELPIIDLEDEKVQSKYTDSFLQTLHYSLDLEKILKKIELDSRSVIQETGANMLYLILGTLQWKEDTNLETTIKSPLVNIPVTLKKGSLDVISGTYEYILEYDGSPIDTNQSLAQRLKNDFDIILPQLIEDISFNDYIEKVEKICKNREFWSTKQEISLDLLQFSKILIYKDLDTKNWDDGVLENNKILNDIFLGKKIENEFNMPKDYDIDTNQVALDIPLIMDADSSQHSAIMDVLYGKNVIIQGPPGTGKSQTISNMIATLISNGKKTLFISEKLSALDVVHKRLVDSNLDEFCLELHSNKTQKVQVLKSLKNSLNKSHNLPRKLKSIKDELEDKKSKIKEYLDTLHLEYGNINKSIFDIIWLVDKYDEVKQYLEFDIENVEQFTLEDLENINKELKDNNISKEKYDLNSSYWKGFEVSNITLNNIDEFVEKLKDLNFEYSQIAILYQDLEILAKRNKIKYSIEDELKEIEEILNLIKIFDNDNIYSKDIDQKLLNNLNSNNINIFKEYIEAYEKSKELDSKNKIVNLDTLDEDNISYIVNFDIKANNLEIKEKSEQTQKNLLKLIDFNKSKIANHTESEIVNSLLKIDDFLYSNLTLSNLDELYKMNKGFIELIFQIEKIGKVFLEQIGLPKIYKINDFMKIHKSLSIIDKLDKSVYSKCMSLLGSSNYLSTIQKAKDQEEELRYFKILCEQNFNIEKLNSKTILEIKNIKNALNKDNKKALNILSSSFRQAKKDYDNLIMNPTSIIDYDKWIEELELAIKYLTLKENYESNEVFKMMFKDLFIGFGTNWKRIEKLNTWGAYIRKEISSEEASTFILSGNSRIYNMISSNLSILDRKILGFYDSIKKLELLYSSDFIKTLWLDKNNITLADLKHKLEKINNNIQRYSYHADNFINNKNISILNTTKIVQNIEFLDDCLTKDNRVILNFISNSIDNNLNISFDNLVKKIIPFFNAQTLNTNEIIKKIKAKALLKDNLNLITNNIKTNLKYDLEDTKEQIDLIKTHIYIINNIKQSNTTQTLKDLLLQYFNEVSHILTKISQENKRTIISSENIKNYGNLNSKIFYNNNEIKKYNFYCEKLDNIDDNINDLSLFIQYEKNKNRIQKLGLTNFIEVIGSKNLSEDLTLKIYYYNFYNSLMKKALNKYPVLDNFNAKEHERLIEEFKELDIKLLKINRQYIASNISSKAKMPKSNDAGAISTYTNQKLIEHEISKKVKHIPIRQLIKRAGEAIQTLKPCFMMSPLSVSQYLPPKEIQFDVLLIDEASQLKPEDILGIIGRVKQVVIVGDPKQLPPTTFFDTINNEEKDENENSILNDSESILDSFMNLYNSTRNLKWHYRSHHESLIDFSNQHFYNNDLTVFPSPTSMNSNDLGLKHTYIENGFYESGAGKRYNNEEANIIVENIEKQMRKFPNNSLGVGTLNASQRDLIQKMIDKKEKTNPIISKYISKWNDTSEPFFIKNIESLQGDERDAIFISTTFGPDKDNGKLIQRFGPINQEAGWRRLNVLITRSKNKMHIFTSIKSTDILTNEKSSKGIVALKSFINFLETRILFNKPDLVNTQEFDSLFVESVYNILKKEGFKLVTKVGVAGYFVDLAVVSKEGEDFILAIECDGKEYNSSKSTRDRDRLKPEVMNSLGWDIYRIWSIDWYKNKDEEIRKLLNIIKEKQKIYSQNII